MDFPIVNKQNNIFFNFHKTFPPSARFTSHRMLIFPQNNIYDLERKNSSKLVSIFFLYKIKMLDKRVWKGNREI